MGEKAERYRLVFHYYEGGTKTLTLKFQNGEVKSKFALTEIDVFTSNFANEDELAHALNVVFSGFENGYFDIEYNAGGTVKPLELVFNDMPFIRGLAMDNIRKSVIPKSKITGYMRGFLAEIEKDPDFLKFIFEKRYTNKYFRNALNYYLMLKNSYDKDAQSVAWQAEAKLCKEFCRYKTIRGIEVGRHNYELMRQNKAIARDPFLERAMVEDNSQKCKKTSLDDGQMALFNINDYSDDNVKRTRK